MNSVMADAKPKCLVIDEIDGSLGEGKGAVEAILKMIDSEKKYEAGKRSAMQEEQSGKGSSKKRRKNASLCRPVICICNDLYAPALRPLRQVAKVHVFLQPTVSRVVNRLKYICNKEGFRTKSAGLTALAEYTGELNLSMFYGLLDSMEVAMSVLEGMNGCDIKSIFIKMLLQAVQGYEISKEPYLLMLMMLIAHRENQLSNIRKCDIRSCLNTLQFLNKKKEILNVLEISSQVIGRKDVSRSVFDVWKEVFQKRKVKRERKAIDSRSLMSREFDSLQSLISNCGEYELTMDGIHENVLQLSYHDPMMQKTVECLNIFGVSDYLHKHIMRTQQMSLLAYQPSTAIAIHRLVAQIEKPTIEWPKSFQKYRMTLTEKKDLLKCWQNKISPSVSRHLTTECFVEDAISPLLHILSPPTLRPVALHLQSERENDDLSQLVDTMLSYTITYKNSILELPASTLRYEAYADTSTLVFDPPINEFINFKGYNSGLFGLSLAMKQVVLHKVERQKILRESITKPSHSSNGSNMNAHDFSGTERNTTFSAKTATVTAYANNSIQYTKDNSHPGQQKTNTVVEVLALESNKSSTVNGKLKSHDVPKKRSGGSSCFFDRFRKSGETSSQNRENVKKSATLERDSRPLLFKYNEGFTNAVKRPVRIRDLLL
ncbi:hypothetical protein GIB67_006520 [Kingdonia uniflora]|uniref:Uncharacterized protein n=1 Tax=Kingdonia uniflora TaxID=39325 RepID=A0A7J7LEM1_9MAGN|nr:hypothetical protein GIB67_006520 [Kingdonia uniflora]